MNVTMNNDQKPRKLARRVTPTYLENAALYYLQRFASSTANLRRVLTRKVTASSRDHGTDPTEGAAMVEALLQRYVACNLLNDESYAAARTASLNRQGRSTRAIRQKLAQKGVESQLVDTAISTLRDETPGDLDLTAAAHLARRRRLGPYRPAAAREANHDRDLAALARAGFGYEIARRIIEASGPEMIEEMLEEE